MPGTYSQLLLHVVFSTKHRQNWLTSEIAPRMYSYLGGIVRSEKCALLAIGGVADHVHLYLRWRPEVSISELMRTLKSRSSRWLHDEFTHLSHFAWQEGYGAFTVSKSQEAAVKNYIARQAEHHRAIDFKSELVDLLKRHDIEYDERYIFE
ncbi:MAG TPA: IS200/IS605 family transposase [Caulifigura sp.]|jgi:REP element-mobilizing transposase RayT|nr:IS200/IS605 family transposase [Caulifigura sp.]